MKIRIINTNRGYCPSSIKEAFQHLSGMTRYSMQKYLEKNYFDFYTFTPGVDFSCSPGYDFQVECSL